MGNITEPLCIQGLLGSIHWHPHYKWKELKIYLTNRIAIGIWSCFPPARSTSSFRSFASARMGTTTWPPCSRLSALGTPYSSKRSRTRRQARTSLSARCQVFQWITQTSSSKLLTSSERRLASISTSRCVWRSRCRRKRGSGEAAGTAPPPSSLPTNSPDALRPWKILRSGQPSSDLTSPSSSQGEPATAQDEERSLPPWNPCHQPAFT
mmetsp:Transcript_40854/g.52600  ORF Transcript_40854/g.52600 Transcript_40854/m.52600 type:complete len:209 (-) Transcript_40854:974-1600(-)